MKRTMTMGLVAMVPLLAAVAVTLAGPESPWIPPAKELYPYAAFKHTVDCRPGGQTVALAWGSRGTAIGVYVYGPDGECIGSDDAPGERLDERIVAFVPVKSGPYEMTVRSFSGRATQVAASLRAGGSE